MDVVMDNLSLILFLESPRIILVHVRRRQKRLD